MEWVTAWQIMLLLVAALWGVVALVLKPASSEECESNRLRLVNFFLFLAIFSGGVATLTHSLQPGISTDIPLGVAIMTAYILCVLCALYLPFKKYIRILLLAVIIVLPFLAACFVLSRPAVSQDYAQYYSSVGEKAEAPKGVVESTATLVPFYFVRQLNITCVDDDRDCLELLSRLDRRKSLPLFLARLLFWFSCVFVVIRYYGDIFKQREEDRRDEEVDYDLRGSVIAQSASVISFCVALFMALLIVGINFAQLGLFGGLVGAGVSVALRDTLGNFAAGILLLWDGTIKKGDVVTIEETSNPETGGTYGIVEDVRLRYTLVKDRDTVHRLIPNSILINSVVENWTHDSQKFVRLKVKVPVPYSAKLREVRQILESSCYEVVRVLPNPAPKALVTEFADSAIVFSLRFWITDPENGIRGVISEVYTFVSERLADIGLTIPFPQMDVHVKEVPISSPPMLNEKPATRELPEEQGAAT